MRCSCPITQLRSRCFPRPAPAPAPSWPATIACSGGSLATLPPPPSMPRKVCSMSSALERRAALQQEVCSQLRSTQAPAVTPTLAWPASAPSRGTGRAWSARRATALAGQAAAAATRPGRTSGLTWNPIPFCSDTYRLRYIAPMDGIYTFSTNDSSTTIDSVVAVWSGCTEELDCSDNAAGTRAVVSSVRSLLVPFVVLTTT